MIEPEFDIETHIAGTAFSGIEIRMRVAMRKAKTFADWLVVCDELVIASRLRPDEPKGLRFALAAQFRQDCPHEDLVRRFKRRRTHHQPKFVATLGDALPPEVRAKLLALVSAAA